MEIIEALHSRRTIRSFTTKPVSQDILKQIVDAARYSPSGANRNPWRFIITTDRTKLDALSQTQQFCKWFNSAQAAIVVAGDPAGSPYWLEDCCLAAYSIFLSGLAHGIGVAWAAIYQSNNPAEDTRRQDYVRGLFSIPQELKVPVVLALGYPQNPPQPRKMPALEEVVSWEKYGQK